MFNLPDFGEELRPAESAWRGDVPWAFDSTMVKSWLRCPRYFQYKHIEGWQQEQRSVHLLFGGWYAKALETYHKLMILEGLDHDQALARVVRAVLSWTWGPAFPLHSGEPGPWQSPHEIKTRETLLRAVIWYLDEYKNDHYPVHIFADGTPAVEVSFRFEISPGLLYCGHYDRIVEKNKRTFPMDQKTTSFVLNHRFWGMFSPDIQMSGYTYSTEFAFGFRSRGVIIDAAQIQAGAINFGRQTAPYASSGKDEWLAMVRHHTSDIIRACESGFFPMNPEGCEAYGGCEFRKICRLPESLRGKWLRADHQRQPRWDPLIQR